MLISIWLEFKRGIKDMTGIRRRYPSMPGLCWGGGTPGHLLPPVIFSIVREWTSLLSKATSNNLQHFKSSSVSEMCWGWVYSRAPDEDDWLGQRVDTVIASWSISSLSRIFSFLFFSKNVNSIIVASVINYIPLTKETTHQNVILATFIKVL